MSYYICPVMKWLANEELLCLKLYKVLRQTTDFIHRVVFNVLQWSV